MHIIKTAASIPTKFCTAIKTTKCPTWVVRTHTTNPRWRTAAILEKSKNSHISARVGPIATKFVTLTQFDPLDHSVWKIGPSSCTFSLVYTLDILCSYSKAFAVQNDEIACLNFDNKTAKIYVLKNCSLYTLLTPTDQKPQKIIKDTINHTNIDIQAML